MNFLKTVFGASNPKAILTGILTVLFFLAGKFGLHMTAEDSNAILAIGLFVVGFFVHDGSVGNWRSTLTGAVGGLLYLLARFGLHLTPDIQSTILTIVGFVVGWLARVPGMQNPGPEPIPKAGT